jgi:hypothetical protein
MNGKTHGGVARLVTGMGAAGLLAVTLAAATACSGSGGAATAKNTAKPAAAGASAPASSAPATHAQTTASALSGRWKGQYGGSYQGTFVLHWHQSGSNLSGLIHLSNPGSTLPIHGSVSGGKIRFGTVGSMAVTYTGTVSGNSMSGTYHINNGSGAGGPWSASKS